MNLNKLFPIILFFVALWLFIFIYIIKNKEDKIRSKYEKRIFTTNNITKNIKNIESWDWISDDYEKNIAKEVIKEYKKNLKYIEKKDNKILIYPIEWFNTIHFIEKIWWISNYKASYKNKNPIFEISIKWIIYNWRYFFKWNNIYWFKKFKWPFWTQYSPENRSSQALQIQWFYIDLEENTKKIKDKLWVKEWEKFISLHEWNLIHYELMWLPQTINILIGIFENFMKDNNIKYWIKNW